MSDEATQGSRLSGEDVDAYFMASFPTRRRVLVDPETYLEFDPQQEQVRLLTPGVEVTSELGGFERISVDVINEFGEGEWTELRVDAREAHYEAYLVLAAVVDLMRGGRSFASAIAESVDSFGDLLRRTHRLSDEAQIGLFGELLFAAHAATALSAEEVMNAWLGPANEEHDYVFEGFDTEVKTTRAEERVHLIGSITQLEASIDRPLYLLSIQITDAGAARQGRTLGEQIDVVRRLLNPRLASVFDSRVETLGWRQEDAEYYPKRWMLRTNPTAYLVGADFPAITTSRLQLAVPQPALVGGVQYRVNVTNIDASVPPEPLGSFVANGVEA